MFDWYPEHEQLLAHLQLVLFMMGMGATLSPADFGRIFRRPRSLLLGLAGQLVVSPLVALAIIWIGRFEGGIAMGLLLVAALPGGNLSKVFTYIARGNVALSISMSAAATLICVATIPLTLHLAAAIALSAGIEMPADTIIINELLVFLLTPLGMGMLLTRLVPRQRRMISRLLIWLGLLIAVIMVVCSVGSRRITGWEYGWPVPLAVIAYCVLSQQLAMAPMRLLRWPSTDSVAVGIETTMRNINLALALVVLIFPARGEDPIAGGVWFVILYYAATALIAGIPLAVRVRRAIRREQVRAARQNIVAESDTSDSVAVLASGRASP